MTLIYRALWQDDQPRLQSVAQKIFAEWVSEKYENLVENPSTPCSTYTHDGEVTYRTEAGVGEPSQSSLMEVVRSNLTETFHNGGSRWETRLRAWTTSDDSAEGTGSRGWVWVDVSAVGEDIDPRTLSPAAPRFVRRLLRVSGSAYTNEIPLDCDVLRYSGAREGDALAELISSPNRVNPIVVFSEPTTGPQTLHPGSFPFTFEDVVRRTADRTAGIARVAMCDKSAGQALTDALGESHGVWGGALRIYMRDVDPAVSNDAVRHRYVLPHRFQNRRDAAPHLVAQTLSPYSAVQRPPAEYETAKRILDQSVAGDDAATRLRRTSDELDAAQTSVIELREQVKTLLDQINGQAIDSEILAETMNELRTENDMHARHIAYLEDRLKRFDAHDLFASSSYAHALIPTKVSSTTEAIVLARQHLNSRVVIHPDAVDNVDLEKFDAANASTAIAFNTWHGLRSLYAYATEMVENPDRNDSFWMWCKNSDHPWKWRATSTSLAMRESKTVGDHPDARTFPVPEYVASSGKLYMDKHLKFDTNGEHAPRIYFHWDKDSAQIHIGFFGPHTKLRNSTT